MKIFLVIILDCFLVLCPAQNTWAKWSADQPFSPTAQVAAQQAVASLGPTRGALSLLSDVRTIVGLDANLQNAGLGLTAEVEDLNQAMGDLGAQVTQAQIIVELSSDVLFDFDKFNIKPEAESELKKLSVIIKQKAKHVEILGFTDSKGGEAYNQNLSLKRANSVMSWLVQQTGIPPTLLSTKGLGEANPTAPNSNKDGSDNPNGRAKNRRVKIVISQR